jgi:hypothetical protein
VAGLICTAPAPGQSPGKTKRETMKHTDITPEQWRVLKCSILKPDYSFDLRDLERAVMARFHLDKATAKRLVRRHDQQNTAKPGDISKLWQQATL